MFKPELLIKARQYGGDKLVKMIEVLSNLYDLADVIRQAQVGGMITEGQRDELIALI